MSVRRLPFVMVAWVPASPLLFPQFQPVGRGPHDPNPPRGGGGTGKILHVGGLVAPLEHGGTTGPKAAAMLGAFASLELRLGIPQFSSRVLA